MIHAKGKLTRPTTVVDRTLRLTEQNGADRDRNPQSRLLYAHTALAYVPRLLGAMDRNPYRPTYGCLDRQYWHYRTSAFPSEMYTEGVLPLALVYARALPGNRWRADAQIKQWAVAAMRFSARSAHRDGSCDDYYPFERALGAAVFSLAACTEAYRLLELNDDQLVTAMRRRADWLIARDESGRLANHQALAALALARCARITGDATYARAAEDRVRRTLTWQSSEGWFDEYGGADPGYQTVAIDALAKYRRLSGAAWLDEPLHRAVEFAGWFLHPDHSFAGEYGSRGTYHFYPHGLELMAGDNATAAALADGFLAGLRDGTVACFDDDRLMAHRAGNLIEAYLDWSPRGGTGGGDSSRPRKRFFTEARLLVRRNPTCHTIASAARGGVFKHFVAGMPAVTDAGLIVELGNGRVAVSQWHDRTRRTVYSAIGAAGCNGSGRIAELTVSGPLHFVRFETATPWKQILLHAGMLLVGRFCRGAVRRLLQRRLITGRRPCPVRLTRVLQLLDAAGGGDDSEAQGATLRVIDRIEIDNPRVTVRRMSFGADHQTAYVAASGVYQEAVRRPWTDLSEYVPELNFRRRVTIERLF
jgi:hypothetical protein